MLIIYSHPNKNGHSGKILSEVVTHLKDKNKRYSILDLYKMNYDPVLRPDEHYSSGSTRINQVNKEIQKLIKINKKFIFIYPTWWNNMPAILKGFIERVFVSGFAFRFVGKIPKKLLEGRAVVFSTTGGPRFFAKYFGCDRALKVLVKDVLRFCGIQARGYSIGSAKKINKTQIKKIKKTVNKGLAYLLKID